MKRSFLLLPPVAATAFPILAQDVGRASKRALHWLTLTDAAGFGVACAD